MTKAALLLVVGEPFDDAQKVLIQEKIGEELQGWNDDLANCELQKELEELVASEAKPDSDNVIAHNSDNLSTTILFNPEKRQFLNALQNFLQVESRYRYLTYAGQTITGSGSWILQDEVLTFRDFTKALKEDGNGANGKDFGLNISLPFINDWNKNNFSKLSNLGVKMASTETAKKTQNLDSFCTYISQHVIAKNLNDVLKTSSTIGMINFSGPTLYIFPGGNGSSSLFGNKDFTALVDGGYSRKSCFWDFMRHLHRVDVIVQTHLGASNFFGMQSFVERKAETGLPDVGSVFLNCPEKFKKPPTSTGLKVNLFQNGATLVETLNTIGLPPQSCYSPQPLHPITLYNKIGFGSIEMYVLSPSHSSEELKNFLNQWSLRSESEHFSTHSGIPVSNTLSMSFLLVWKPFSPHGKIIRLLFPGGTTKSKIFEGLDRLKSIAIFERFQCSQSEINDKSNISAKPSKSVPSRPVNLKPAPSKLNGEEAKTKPTHESKDLTSAKSRTVSDVKETTPTRTGAAARPTKLEHKKPEKSSPAVSSTPAVKVESKPAAKAPSPSKTTKDVKSTGRAAETLPAAKKQVPKTNEIESSPKNKPNKLTQSEAVKQTKPVKLTEAVKQKMPESKQLKEQKTVKQTEVGKQTKTESVVQQHGAVKQAVKKPHMQLDLKKEKLKDKKTPEKVIPKEPVPAKVVGEAVRIAEAVPVRSVPLPPVQDIKIEAEPTVAEEVVNVVETAPKVVDYDIPSPEDVAQMSQEDEDSFVEELPTEMEPGYEEQQELSKDQTRLNDRDMLKDAADKNEVMEGVTEAEISEQRKVELDINASKDVDDFLDESNITVVQQSVLESSKDEVEQEVVEKQDYEEDRECAVNGSRTIWHYKVTGEDGEEVPEDVHEVAEPVHEVAEDIHEEIDEPVHEVPEVVHEKVPEDIRENGHEIAENTHEEIAQDVHEEIAERVHGVTEVVHEEIPAEHVHEVAEGIHEDVDDEVDEDMCDKVAEAAVNILHDDSAAAFDHGMRYGAESPDVLEDQEELVDVDHVKLNERGPRDDHEADQEWTVLDRSEILEEADRMGAVAAVCTPAYEVKDERAEDADFGMKEEYVAAAVVKAEEIQPCMDRALPTDAEKDEEEEEDDLDAVPEEEDVEEEGRRRLDDEDDEERASDGSDEVPDVEREGEFEMFQKSVTSQLESQAMSRSLLSDRDLDNAEDFVLEEALVGASHVEPELSHVEPKASHVEPEVSHAELEGSDVELEVSHVEPKASHVELEGSDVELEVSHVEPKASHVELGTSHLEPEITHAEPELSDAEPEASHAEPESSHVEPMTTHVEPITTHAEPQLYPTAEDEDEDLGVEVVSDVGLREGSDGAIPADMGDGSGPEDEPCVEEPVEEDTDEEQHFSLKKDTAIENLAAICSTAGRSADVMLDDGLPDLVAPCGVIDVEPVEKESFSSEIEKVDQEKEFEEEEQDEEQDEAVDMGVRPHDLHTSDDESPSQESYALDDVASELVEKVMTASLTSENLASQREYTEDDMYAMKSEVYRRGEMTRDDGRDDYYRKEMEQDEEEEEMCEKERTAALFGMDDTKFEDDQMICPVVRGFSECQPVNFGGVHDDFSMGKVEEVKNLINMGETESKGEVDASGRLNFGFDDFLAEREKCREEMVLEGFGQVGEVKEKTGEDSGESDLEFGNEGCVPRGNLEVNEYEDGGKMDEGFEDEGAASLVEMQQQKYENRQAGSFFAAACVVPGVDDEECEAFPVADDFEVGVSEKSDVPLLDLGDDGEMVSSSEKYGCGMVVVEPVGGHGMTESVSNRNPFLFSGFEEPKQEARQPLSSPSPEPEAFERRHREDHLDVESDEFDPNVEEEEGCVIQPVQTGFLEAVPVVGRDTDAEKESGFENPEYTPDDETTGDTPETDEDVLAEQKGEAEESEEISVDNTQTPSWRNYDNVQQQETETRTSGAAEYMTEEMEEMDRDINENVDVVGEEDDLEKVSTQSNASEEESRSSALESEPNDRPESMDSDAEADPVKSWGAPMGLPAPMQDSNRHKSKPKPNQDGGAANITLPVGDKKAAEKIGDRSFMAPQKKSNDTRKSLPQRPSAMTHHGDGKDENGAMLKDAKTALNKKQPATAVGIAKTKKPAEAVAKSKHAKPVVPFYVDLTYIPGNGDPSAVDVDFFRRVRAHYYVLNALEPDPKVLSWLIEGKQTWENKDVPVNVIPTYDSVALHRWSRDNAKQLEDLAISILPAANKCTIRLEDKDESCFAFRIEF